MSHNYDNDTWDLIPSKCRAPACRCESPCDDIGGTYVCTSCGRVPDSCQCDRCGDCDQFADDCSCEDEDLRNDEDDDEVAPPPVPRTWLPPQMRAMNAAMPGCTGCAELRAEVAVLRAQRPLDGGK